MAYPQSVLDDIQSRLSIVDVVSEYVTLQKKGNNYTGLCPFHQEKSPSFSVSPVKNVYHCFGCGKGGGLFQFVMEMEKLRFSEAVEHLARIAGVDLVFKTQVDDWKETQRSALLELLRRVTGTFRHFLLGEKGREARDYLRRRGISEESEEKFQLGFLPQDRHWLWSFLLGKQYNEETLRTSGLFAPKSTATLFSGRLLFPIQNARGEVVAFGGRLLKGEGPKYINSHETALFQKRSTLYGLFLALGAARSDARLIITEGYMDVISLFQAGIPRAVAPLGTSLTNEHLEIARRYGFRIQFFLDADAAGVNALWKSLALAETHEVDSDLLLASEGCKDPAEVLEQKGPQALVACAENPLQPMDYLLPRIFPPSGNPGKAAMAAAPKFFDFLRNVPSQLKKDFYFSVFSRVYGVDPESRRKDYIRGAGTPKKLEVKKIKEDQGVGGFEWHLAATLITHPEHYAYFRSHAALEDFCDGEIREVMELLDKNYFMQYFSGQISVTSALEMLPERLKRDLVRRIQLGETDQNPEKVVGESLKKFHRRTLSMKRDSLKKTLALLKESEEVERVLGELMYLDREMEKLRNTLHE